MVEKYTDFEIQCDVPDGKQYVLATDYAALEAERDEWKRTNELNLDRLKKIVDYIGRCNSTFVPASWCKADAIAEGRDNG